MLRSSLSTKEINILTRLNSPQKVQDYLDCMPFNHEYSGETQMSPRRVLKEKKAHCFEGALLASVAFWLHGEEPLLLSLIVEDEDWPHALALFKLNGHWGAISKTNHAVLRYRDPIYRTIRELVLSYFHEYFLVSNGKKTLVGYSRPINLKRFGTDWITSENNLFNMTHNIIGMKHFSIIPKQKKDGSRDDILRKANKFERKIASIQEWEK